MKTTIKILKTKKYDFSKSDLVLAIVMFSASAISLMIFSIFFSIIFFAFGSFHFYNFYKSVNVRKIIRTEVKHKFNFSEYLSMVIQKYKAKLKCFKLQEKGVDCGLHFDIRGWKAYKINKNGEAEEI